jgi:hypothetical protein
MPARKLGGEPQLRRICARNKVLVFCGRVWSPHLQDSRGGEDIRNYLRMMAEDVGILRGIYEKI